mmetsp:Transcript_18301/g.41845  ORF Transcript_18301/g.41845 Transcript_18301/m.41845 type:complete len:287 (+) Transcript_18301:1122-1982(+)
MSSASMTTTQVLTPGCLSFQLGSLALGKDIRIQLDPEVYLFNSFFFLSGADCGFPFFFPSRPPLTSYTFPTSSCSSVSSSSSFSSPVSSTLPTPPISPHLICPVRVSTVSADRAQCGSLHQSAGGRANSSASPLIPRVSTIVGRRSVSDASPMGNPPIRWTSGGILAKVRMSPKCDTTAPGDPLGVKPTSISSSDPIRATPVQRNRPFCSSRKTRREMGIPARTFPPRPSTAAARAWQRGRGPPMGYQYPWGWAAAARLLMWAPMLASAGGRFSFLRPSAATKLRT